MPPNLLLFEDFELDRGAYMLRRSGRAVRLERIPLDLLFLLVERPGQLVTRDEIFERIWGKDVFLDTDNSINAAIRKLRQALDENADAPRFIETVPSKGYRFVASVHQAPPEAPQFPFTNSEPARRQAEIVDLHSNAPVGQPTSPKPEASEPGIGRGKRRTFVASAVALTLAVFCYWVLARSHNEIATALRVYLPRLLPTEVHQKTGYCTTSDGVRIAYGISSHGPPLIIVVGFLTHLELGAFSPTYNSGFLKPLVNRRMVVQYDGRGSGMSDRGLKDYSLQPRVRDLEAVVDALKLDKFALFAISAGGPAAIAYAVRHPEHVTHLVLCGTSADSNPGPETPDEQANREAGLRLLRNGWGNPAIRGMFVSLAIPNGSEVDKELFSEMLRLSTTPEDFGAFSSADDKIDVRSLAQQVRTPTLVLQVRGDQLSPIHYSKELATLIPGARLVFIEGKDHIPVPGDGEMEQISQAVSPFIEEEFPKETSSATQR